MENEEITKIIEKVSVETGKSVRVVREIWQGMWMFQLDFHRPSVTDRDIKNVFYDPVDQKVALALAALNNGKFERNWH